jgi:hypothetical protein
MFVEHRTKSRAPSPAIHTRAMRALLVPIAAAGLALLLASCACRCDADDLVRDMAAEGAVDCGRATTSEARPAVTACIEDAIARGAPFSGGWSRLGTDSEVRTYVVEDATGQVWMLGFDGDPSGGSGACPTLQGSRCAGALERRTFPLDGEMLVCDSATTTSELVLCGR